jgi:hypothetical protein
VYYDKVTKLSSYKQFQQFQNMIQNLMQGKKVFDEHSAVPQLIFSRPFEPYQPLSLPHLYTLSLIPKLSYAGPRHFDQTLSLFSTKNKDNMNLLICRL